MLGANFVQRDAMTRRMQFRGDLETEWHAYSPETRPIVTAFVAGINAYIDTNRNAWPDEFRLAGWSPEHWAPADLLARTDAFVASDGAQEEVFRARLVAAIGVERVNDLLPLAGGRIVPTAGVDLGDLDKAKLSSF